MSIRKMFLLFAIGLQCAACASDETDPCEGTEGQERVLCECSIDPHCDL